MIELKPVHWGAAGLAALLLNLVVLLALWQLSPSILPPTPDWMQPPVPVQGLPEAAPIAAPEVRPTVPREMPTLPEPPKIAARMKLPVIPGPRDLLPTESLTLDPTPLANPRIDLAAVTGGVALAQLAFDVSEVDQVPVPLHQPQPQYPLAARRQQIAGTVVVRLLIDSQGRVQELEIVRADPPGVFEDGVRRSLTGWRFQPGRLGGQPVTTRVEIPIRFELNS